MCGIVGWYGPGRQRDVDSLRRAAAVIQHRGPDAGGEYVEAEIGLAHRRLSIIDLSEAANQPMTDPEQRAVLIYNGELYNYRQLRRLLDAKGHRFRTSSDTEVVLAAYLEWGAECVRRFRGMFALAIWDRLERRLVLARDPLGIKPLYYRLDGRMVTFASEVKALMVLDPASRRLDREALHDFLTFRYTLAPKTMFEDVFKLAAGHVLIASANGVEVSQYWEPDYRKLEKRTEADWIDCLREKLDEAVASHLVSDVPLGVLLSGGLDSSVVTAVTQAKVRGRVKTFAIGFDAGGVYDERPYARLVARHLGTDHYDIVISAKEFVDSLPSCVWHMDEPVADPAAVPLYWVSRLAREHVTVVLSGEGSDELLAGYSSFWASFKGYHRLRRFKQLRGVVGERVLAAFNRQFVRSRRLERYIEWSRHPIKAYGVLAPVFQDNVLDEDDKRRLYRADRPLDRADSVEKVRAAYRRARDFEFLDQMLYVSMTQWLPEDLLTKADKMTMAHSLELRVPFLDQDVVELVAHMPTDLKVRKTRSGYVEKYALKRAFRGQLPDAVLDRKKLGFAVPYAKWFRDEMRPMIGDLLLSGTGPARQLFEPHEVERLVRVALDEKRVANGVWDPDCKKVWTLLLLDLWAREFRVAVG
jgi:asparagine synthase (glutamine-hydrolysing)